LNKLTVITSTQTVWSIFVKKEHFVQSEPATNLVISVILTANVVIGTLGIEDVTRPIVDAFINAHTTGPFLLGGYSAGLYSCF
jgi:hypothetical protein